MRPGRRLGPAEVAAYDVVDKALARRVRIVAVPFLLPGTDAITLGTLVVVRGARAASASLLVHELVHVRQWAELGVGGFLRRYLGAYLRNLARLRRHRAAYLAIPLEVEAREETRRWSARTGLPGSVSRRRR